MFAIGQLLVESTSGRPDQAGKGCAHFLKASFEAASEWLLQFWQKQKQAACNGEMAVKAR